MYLGIRAIRDQEFLALAVAELAVGQGTQDQGFRVTLEVGYQDFRGTAVVALAGTQVLVILGWVLGQVLQLM